MPAFDAESPESLCVQWCARLASGDSAWPIAAGEAAAGLAQAREFLATRRGDLAARVLEALTARTGDSSAAWQLLGVAYREAQRMPEAIRAFDWAMRLDRNNFQAAFGLAQSILDAGLPAAALFRNALRLAPSDPHAICAYTTALIAEGQRESAEKLLANLVAGNPGWIDGHRCLTSLRYTTGDTLNFARSYEEACQSQSDNLALWLAWFRTVAQTRDWVAAAGVLDRAERQVGVQQALQVARLFIASESGDMERAAELFTATEGVKDETRDIALVRHCLKRGELEQAEQVALPYTETRSAPLVWPYLSLIWRLKGDARAEWLDGTPPFIGVFDLGIHPDELAQLAECLRGLHTASAPYLGQSVRGGTQTDLQIFLRLDPPLARLKSLVQQAIRDYVSNLPPAVNEHPLLAPPRAGVMAGRIGFSGSWSVRLAGQGFNVPHTHPQGWISSALYISIPASEQLGPPPAGWIEFGKPPPELGLKLEPYLRVQPVPGRLVLFPSTTWHSTQPFTDGERLVVAFDVRVPVA